jgi:hypothetical protein
MALLNSYQRARLLLLIACTASFILAWWSGGVFRMPAAPGLDVSLLQQPSPAGAIIVVALVVAICTILGTLIAGVIRFNAGMLTAAVAMAAFSIRGGSLRQTISWGLSLGGPSAIFARLMIETAILAVILAVCFSGVRMAWAAGWVKDRESGQPADTAEMHRNLWPSLAVQAVATAMGLLLLAPVEAKGQVLAALLMSSCGGSILAQYLFPTARSSPNWLAPLIVGMAGFALAIGQHPGVFTADLQGSFAAWARPLPLDYASAGPAGAILGHWMARRWQTQTEETALAASGG